MSRVRRLGAAWGAWADATVVAGVTGLTFRRSVEPGFVGWDDAILLVGKPTFRGLGGAQFRWMAENARLGHSVPITWLSFALGFAAQDAVTALHSYARARATARGLVVERWG